VDKLNGSGGISGLTGGREGGNQIDVVFERHGKGDRVRGLKIGSKNVIAVHRSEHRDFAESCGCTGSNGSIMTRKAKIAVTSQ
jgi:hypothetical protein